VSAANSKRTRARLKLGMWGIIGFFLCLGSASLITYMKIGYDHAPNAGERYIPTQAVEPAGSE